MTRVKTGRHQIEAASDKTVNEGHSRTHSMRHLVIHPNLPLTTQLTIPLLSEPVQMSHVVSCTLFEEHPTDHSIILNWRIHTSGRGPS